eukprot:scaffold1446_cov391-Prasinococcus_capsulatus_cf.AAC.25
MSAHTLSAIQRIQTPSCGGLGIERLTEIVRPLHVVPDAFGRERIALHHGDGYCSLEAIPGLLLNELVFRRVGEPMGVERR